MESVLRDFTRSKQRLLVLGYNATLTTAVEAPRQPKRHFDQIQVGCPSLILSYQIQVQYPYFSPLRCLHLVYYTLGGGVSCDSSSILACKHRCIPLIMQPVLLTGVSPWEPADSPTRNVCTTPSESKAIPDNLYSVKPMTAEGMGPAMKLHWRT